MLTGILSGKKVVVVEVVVKVVVVVVVVVVIVVVVLVVVIIVVVVVVVVVKVSPWWIGPPHPHGDMAAAAMAGSTSVGLHVGPARSMAAAVEAAAGERACLAPASPTRAPVGSRRVRPRQGFETSCCAPLSACPFC